MSGEYKYYCHKCGAQIQETDEVCPNGHIISEVGRRVKPPFCKVVDIVTRQNKEQ